jgi:tetratricopeptide (TPR) repeat protein
MSAVLLAGAAPSLCAQEEEEVLISQAPTAVQVPAQPSSESMTVTPPMQAEAPASAAEVPAQVQEPSAASKSESAPAPKAEPVPAPKAEPAPEPKPEPVRVEAPVEKPAPVRKSAPAVEKQMSSSEKARAELEFLKSAYKNAAAETLASLPEQVDAYLWLYRELENADQAQYLKFEVHEKQGDLLAAAVDLLKLLYEYPDNKLSFNAKKKLMEIADKKLRKQKPAVTEMGKGPEASLDRAGRLIALLRALAGLKENALYAPLSAEFNEFFRRYPENPHVGEMLFLMGQVYAQNGNHETSILLNEKILAVYSPEGPLGAKAQTAIADVYAGALRNYDKAVEAYQSVTDKFAACPESGDAYVKMARILDENLKQPALAVDRLEKIVQLYPKTDAAFQALRDASRIQKDRNKDFGKAVELLVKLADMFPGERAVAGLKDASDLAGGYLKDYTMQAKLLERLAADYPQDKNSAQALWDAAQIYERQLTNASAAKGVYEKLAQGYPSWAKKASKRIEALNK